MGEKSHQSNAQIRHNAKTYLQVITMGLELLKSTRNDSDRFHEILKLIETDAIEPLQVLVADLLQRLEEPQAGNRP